MPVSEIDLEKQLDVEAFPEKAELIVLETVTVPAGSNMPAISYTKDEKLPLQFNPTEFSLSVHSNLDLETNDLVTGNNMVPKLKDRQPNALSVKLLYDAAVEMHSIAKSAALADNLTKFHTAGDLGDGCLLKFHGLPRQTTETKKPPLLCFFFGSTSFIGYASALTIQCTRFDKLGKILRAEISLQMEEAKYDPAQASYELPQKKTEWTSDDNPPATLEDLLNG